MTKKKARISKSVETEESEVIVRPPEVNSVLTIFRDSSDVHAHDRLHTQLKLNFYDKMSINEFSEDFFECMRQILIYQDRASTETPLLFCVKFVTKCMTESNTDSSRNKSNLLLKRFVKFVSYNADKNDSFVRFHCVQVTRLLLSELSDEMTVAEDLFDRLQAMLMKRFWDAKAYVRAEAVQASNRLQDPSDTKCPIVIGLSHISKFDGNYTVRLAALQSLAITTKTLQCVIERVRDVNDLVRKKAFDLLAKWKILKPLSISARLSIVESGLCDKSSVVKRACKELLKVWLVTSDNDVVALLRRLDVDNMESVTEMALYGLLESLSKSEVVSIIDRLKGTMTDQRLIQDDQLTGESAFLWRHLVAFMSDRSQEYEAELETIIPSVPDYEAYLRGIFHKPIEQSMRKEISLDEYAEYCTIIKHLLPLVNYMDVFDSHNRSLITGLIKWALSSVDIPFNYVQHLMKLLAQLETNNVKICDQTVEFINELLFTEVEVDLEDQENVPPPPPTLVAGDPDLDRQDPSDLNKDALRKLRMEIATIDVQINELKESIETGMATSPMEIISKMIDDMRQLESRKKVLLESRLKLTTPLLDNKKEDPEEEEKEEVKVESKDVPAWMTSGSDSRVIKANIMTICMIKECNMLWTMPPSLRSLFHNVVLVSIQHTNTCVREKAILALGLCCLLDKDLAAQYYSIFLKSLEVDVDEIKEVAAKCLTDLLIRFGIEPFQESIIRPLRSMVKNETVDDNDISTENTTTTMTTVDALTEEEQHLCVSTLINPIVVLLDHDKTDLVTTSAICLSKLLYHHKIQCAKFLSRLLVMWFNPHHADNHLLRSHLSGFFANFSLMSRENQTAICDCFLLTMHTLFKAPASSPLSEIDVSNVVDFFLRITDSKYLLQNRVPNICLPPDDTLQTTMTPRDKFALDNPCHDELALLLSDQILSAPMSAETKYYVSMLVRLRLSFSDLEKVDDLARKTGTMISKLKDKKCLQLLSKFHRELEMKVKDAQSTAEHTQRLAATPSGNPLLLEVNSDGNIDTIYRGRGRRTTVKATERSVLGMSHDDQSVFTRDEENVSRRTQEEGSTPRRKQDHRSMSAKSQNDLFDSLSCISDTSSVLEPKVEDTPRKSRSSKTSRQTPQKLSDENMFKKPMDVRVTRSSSRISTRLSSSSFIVPEVPRTTRKK